MKLMCLFRLNLSAALGFTVLFSGVRQIKSCSVFINVYLYVFICLFVYLFNLFSIVFIRVFINLLT